MHEKTIELFLQGEGIEDIKLIHIPQHSTVRELLAKLFAEAGRPEHEAEGLFLILEDQEQELDPNAILHEIGIGHRQRVHCHRCHRIAVTVNFNGAHKEHLFSPATTIGKVKRWADHQFGLHGVDATEHALKLCGTDKRPDEDLHLGSLTQHRECKVCFDLVPKKRVEG